MLVVRRAARAITSETRRAVSMQYSPCRPSNAKAATKAAWRSSFSPSRCVRRGVKDSAGAAFVATYGNSWRAGSWRTVAVKASCKCAKYHETALLQKEKKVLLVVAGRCRGTASVFDCQMSQATTAWPIGAQRKTCDTRSSTCCRHPETRTRSA